MTIPIRSHCCAWTEGGEHARSEVAGRLHAHIRHSMYAQVRSVDVSGAPSNPQHDVGAGGVRALQCEFRQVRLQARQHGRHPPRVSDGSWRHRAWRPVPARRPAAADISGPPGSRVPGGRIDAAVVAPPQRPHLQDRAPRRHVAPSVVPDVIAPAKRPAVQDARARCEKSMSSIRGRSAKAAERLEQAALDEDRLVTGANAGQARAPVHQTRHESQQRRSAVDADIEAAPARAAPRSHPR